MKCHAYYRDAMHAVRKSNRTTWQNKNDFLSRGVNARYVDHKIGRAIFRNFVTSGTNSYNIYSKQFSGAKSARRNNATRRDTVFVPPCEDNCLIVNLNLSNREFKSGRMIGRVFNFFRCHLSRRIKRPFIITRCLMNDSATVCVYTILCAVLSTVW